MARAIAAHMIKHNGRVIKPGETITGLTPEEMARLRESGAIDDKPLLEPSVKDTEEVWREYLIDTGVLAAEDADEMDKAALIAAFAGEAEESEPAKTEPEE